MIVHLGKQKAGAANSRLIAAAVFTVVPTLLTAQGIDPGELTVRKTLYIPRSEFTFKTGTSLVEVGVVVRDNVGRAVPGLVKENFRILENGRPHEITSFSVQSAGAAWAPDVRPAAAAPGPRLRYIALVFDEVVPELRICPVCAGNWQIIKTAAARYVREGVAKGDRVSVFGLYYGQVLDFSTDPEKIASAIDHMNVKWQRPGEKAPTQTLNRIADVVDYLGKLPGDRLLLLATAGLVVGHNYPAHNELIARALRAGVIISGVDAKGLAAPATVIVSSGGRGGGRIGPSTDQPPDEALARFAEATGGEYFKNSNDLLRGMHETMAPAVKYLLGIQLPDVHDGRFHPLKVQLTGTPRHEVVSRPGYFAPAAANEDQTPPRPIDRTVMADDQLAEIAARITVQPGSPDAAVPAIRAIAHMDLKSIAFRDEGSLHIQHVTYIAALFDGQGSYVSGGEATIDFALGDPNLKRLQEAGINCTLQVGAPEGKYRLRTVVQDENGHMAAGSQTVEIR